jgi:hypothetical protein
MLSSGVGMLSSGVEMLSGDVGLLSNGVELLSGGVGMLSRTGGDNAQRCSGMCLQSMLEPCPAG